MKHRKTLRIISCTFIAANIAFSPILSLTVYAAPTSPVLIGEVAWAGSSLSTADEWIELWNTSNATTSVANWSLRGAGESGKTILLPADAVIAPYGTYLISNYSSADARTALAIEPQVVTTTISLSNSNLGIQLIDVNGTLIDSAGTGGTPPSGASLPTKLSMIRNGDAWISATSSTNLKPGTADLATPGICDGCSQPLTSPPTPDPAPTPPSVPIETTSTQIVVTSTDAIPTSTNIAEVVIDAPTDQPAATTTLTSATSTDASATEAVSTSTTTTISTLTSTTDSYSASLTSTPTSDPPPPPKPAYALLRLSEIGPYPTSGKEWIEITTLDAGNPIALDGCTIHDAKSRILTITKAMLDPATSTFVLLPLSGSHLNNDGDTVSLYDPDGHLIDTMTYGKTMKGAVWIRWPDVTGVWQETLQPTPGAANAFLTAAKPATTVADTTTVSSSTTTETETPQPEEQTTVPEEPTNEGATDIAAIKAAAATVVVPTKTVKTATKTTKTTTANTTPIQPIDFDMLTTLDLTPQRVLLHGAVATPPGFFKNRSFVLQAPDGRGILVTAPANQRLPEEGQAVSVVGTISFDAQNIPSLKIGAKDRWTTSGTSTEMIQPRLVDLLAPATEDAWSLVHVTGTVMDVKTKTIHLDLEDAEIDVVIRPDVPYRAERLKPGDVITVSGILDTTGVSPIVLPRRADEITLISRAPTPAATTTAAAKGSELPPWTPLGAAGGAIAVTEGAKHLHRRRKNRQLMKKLSDLSLIDTAA